MTVKQLLYQEINACSPVRMGHNIEVNEWPCGGSARGRGCLFHSSWAWLVCSLPLSLRTDNHPKATSTRVASRSLAHMFIPRTTVAQVLSDSQQDAPASESYFSQHLARSYFQCGFVALSLNFASKASEYSRITFLDDTPASSVSSVRPHPSTVSPNLTFYPRLRLPPCSCG